MTAPSRVFERIRGLYVITDDTLVPGRTHQSIAEAAVRAGVRAIQFRDKRKGTGELVRIARELVSIAREAGATLIVNDRVDVALASGADGVHLGSSDMAPGDARRLLGPGAILGFSPEDDGQALAARDAGVDYLGVGPIYETQSKSDAGPAVGLPRIAELAALTSLPIVAIGGITVGRAAEVWKAAATGVAVISAVVAAPDPEAAARAMLAVLRDERRGA